MSDDWKVGDLALCVDASPPRTGKVVPPSIKLERDRVYEITRILVCEDGLGVLVDNEPPHFGLTIETGWATDRFRKIKPDAREGNAEDWALILETAKPKVRPSLLGVEGD